MPCLLPHLVSALLATTSLVEQILIFQAFHVVPTRLLAQAHLYLPFLLSLLRDPLFLFFRIFQEVPWDLEDLSFPLIPSCHVVLSLQWDQDIRGDLQDRPSLLTYSTWWASVVQTVCWFLFSLHVWWCQWKCRSKRFFAFLPGWLLMPLLATSWLQ